MTVSQSVKTKVIVLTASSGSQNIVADSERKMVVRSKKIGKLGGWRFTIYSSDVPNFSVSAKVYKIQWTPSNVEEYPAIEPLGKAESELREVTAHRIGAMEEEWERTLYGSSCTH